MCTFYEYIAFGTSSSLSNGLGRDSDAQKCLSEVGEGHHIYELFSLHKYDLSGDPKTTKQAMRRFIRRAFSIDEQGLHEALGQLPDVYGGKSSCRHSHRH